MLAALRHAASLYELELNNDKSAIHPTSLRQPKGWQRAARANIPRAQILGASVDGGAVEHFLYQLGRVCLAHPDINVEKYGLQNARSSLVNVDKWEPLQFALISAYRRNSSLISLLVEICLLRQVSHGDVQLGILAEFIENRIPVLAGAHRTGEIVWLLFMAARLRLPLAAGKLKSLFSIENAFIALLVVFLHREGLVGGNVDRRAWDQSLNQEGLRGPMWFYAYEAVSAGLLPGVSDDYVAEDPYFSLLRRRRVHFFDIARGYSSVAAVLRSLRRDNDRLRRLREVTLEAEDPMDWGGVEHDEGDQFGIDDIY
jgi:hypothetical protein